MGATFGVSMIVGPAIGWRAMQHRWYVWVWLVAATISLITLLFMIFWLKESLDVDKRDTTPIQLRHALNIFKRFAIIGTFPAVIRLFWVYALFAIMFIWYTSTNILYAKQYLGFDPAQVSMMYIIMGIFLIINQWFTVRKLLDFFSEKKLFLVGICSVAISLLIYIVQPGIWLFYLSAFFSTLGIALCMATFKGIITQTVDHTAQGKIIGLDESVMAWSRVIVPALAAWAFAMIGHWVFVWFGVIWLVALWLDWRVTKNEKK
jgi:Na+/melibiose symporter-like transporter